MALTTTGSSSSQTTTQNPQTSTGGGGPSTASLQPGVSSKLLAGGNGVSLTNQPLLTIPLGASSTQANTTTTSSPLAPAHHVNAALLGLPLVLLAIAAISFWITSRSVKSTTKYT